MIEPNSVILKGGLNLVTPAKAVPPGMVINCENYEADESGYTSIEGFERLDGRPKPSEAVYYEMSVELTSPVLRGDVVAGLGSGATAILLANAGQTETRLTMTELNGQFINGEQLAVAAVSVGVCRGEAIDNGATSDEEHRSFSKAAIDRRRELIEKVPGSGPVRCVFELKSDIYAIRDNASGAAATLYKASSEGWQTIPETRVLSYKSSSAEISEGSTIAGVSSSATASVLRSVILKNTWGNSGEGFLVVNSQNGNFQPDEPLSIDATNVAVATANSSVIKIPAGGRYEVVTHNFYGSTGTDCAYVVNGIGPGYEFDGTSVAPLRTGLSEELEKPVCVQVFAEHLFLGYRSGTAIFSETGIPVQFRTTNGAGEVGLGCPIRALPKAYSSVLVFIGRDRIAYLSGTSKDDFRLVELNESAGGYAGTSQLFSDLVYMDKGGVRALASTQKFGNFRAGSVSALIEPWWKNKRKQKVYPIGSLAVPSKDIYRLFFSDHTVVSFYLGGRRPEAMHVNYPFNFECGWSSIDDDDEEVILVGAQDGFVYQLDKGNSFDGEPIRGFCKLPYNSFGQPNQNKTFYKATFEISGGRQTKLGLVAEFSYGNPDQPPSGEQAFDVRGGGGVWGTSNWNEFLWSTQHVGQAKAYVDGYGSNVSATVFYEAQEDRPHTLSIATFHYSQRGAVR